MSDLNKAVSVVELVVVILGLCVAPRETPAPEGARAAGGDLTAPLGPTPGDRTGDPRGVLSNSPRCVGDNGAWSTGKDGVTSDNDDTDVEEEGLVGDL